ncbi:MAG: hypothetical protein H8E10_18515 [Desulfobacterales bacterium]|nr:hypothetical protein [Desulfobacterales bacterium]MBL7205125.1 hypothetical protein [Desulfobacteraceae bacterium]
MEIIHQLPGRVRVRIPKLGSKDYCQQVVKELGNDDRIQDLRISSACNSLTVCYDAMRIEIKDVLDLLGEEKLIKQPAAKKEPATMKYFKPAVSISVQERIRQIIKSEDPQKPYSDDNISGLLKEEKIEIARRTVAKYRESLGILPSNKRKKLDAR